jgi:hypothetical protein
VDFDVEVFQDNGVTKVAEDSVCFLNQQYAARTVALKKSTNFANCLLPVAFAASTSSNAATIWKPFRSA